MVPDVIELQEQQEAEEKQFQRDLDSLYVLPLRILPLGSTARQRANLVLDSRLKSAFEIFCD